MDPSRAAELTDFIQQLDAEIPLNPELLALVDQALTHVSSGRARNLERLEFLGDAVLRLAATEFIDRHHTDHIPQPHRIGEPAHGLFRVSATFRVAGLVFVGFGQESKPTQAAGLHHG